MSYMITMSCAYVLLTIRVQYVTIHMHFEFDSIYALFSVYSKMVIPTKISR